MSSLWPDDNPRMGQVITCFVDQPIPYTESRDPPVDDASFGDGGCWNFPSVYVAVLENTDGLALTKVGYSRWPENRLTELHYSTGCNLNLRQRIWLYATFELREAKRAEAQAHEILQCERAEGEWFACTPEHACWAVNWAIELVRDPPKMRQASSRYRASAMRRHGIAL